MVTPGTKCDKSQKSLAVAENHGRSFFFPGFRTFDDEAVEEHLDWMRWTETTNMSVNSQRHFHTNTLQHRVQTKIRYKSKHFHTLKCWHAHEFQRDQKKRKKEKKAHEQMSSTCLNICIHVYKIPIGDHGGTNQMTSKCAAALVF